MAPVAREEEGMTKTQTYRAVVKPLIEKKRRARINSCLNELKDLMLFALQTEAESISKLEKADILELTVNHLRKLKRQQMWSLNPALDLDRFHTGSDCGYSSGKESTPSTNFPALPLAPSKEEKTVWRPF